MCIHFILNYHVLRLAYFILKIKLFFIRVLNILEENSKQRGKTSMTAIEELFIVSLMCSALPLSPEYAALVRCVAAFFPRRYS